MKQLAAYVQPHRLTRVVRALHEAPRFPGFTVLHAHGQGRGRGAGGRYAFGGDELLYHERCVVVVVCEDEEAAALADSIARAAHTGKQGDGLVTICPIESVVRVREIRAPGSDS